MSDEKAVGRVVAIARELQIATDIWVNAAAREVAFVLSDKPTKIEEALRLAFDLASRFADEHDRRHAQKLKDAGISEDIARQR